MNLGSQSLFIFVMIVKIIVMFTLIWPLSKCFPSFKKKFEEMKLNLFFNEFFLIVFEGYFSILLCSFFNLSAPDMNLDKNLINTLISYFFLVILLILVPGALVYIIVQPLKVLKL